MFKDWVLGTVSRAVAGLKGKYKMPACRRHFYRVYFSVVRRAPIIQTHRCAGHLGYCQSGVGGQAQ